MTPLQVGEALPPLGLQTEDGTPFDQTSILGTPTIFYFMRSATCGICLGHIQRIAKKLVGNENDVQVFVVVPGGSEEAQQVTQQVPFPVLVRDRGARSVGLGRRLLGAVQGSGTLLLDSRGPRRFFQTRHASDASLRRNGAVSDASDPLEVGSK